MHTSLPPSLQDNLCLMSSNHVIPSSAILPAGPSRTGRFPGWVCQALSTQTHCSLVPAQWDAARKGKEILQRRAICSSAGRHQRQPFLSIQNRGKWASARALLQSLICALTTVFKARAQLLPSSAPLLQPMAPETISPRPARWLPSYLGWQKKAPCSLSHSLSAKLLTLDP